MSIFNSALQTYRKVVPKSARQFIKNEYADVTASNLFDPNYANRTWFPTAKAAGTKQTNTTTPFDPNAEWQMGGWASADEMAQAAAMGYTGPKSGFQDWYNQQYNNATQPSGGSGGSTNAPLGSVRFNGRTYNLDNPAENQAFFSDKLNALTTARDQAIATGKQSSQSQIAQIDQAIADTYSQAKQYVQSYNQNVNQFGDNYSLGNVKRGAFYAGLSPNAFQSSQGDSALYAQNQYLQGLGDLAQEAQSNVGANFLANPNDMSQLDQGSVYGRNIAQNQQQQASVANAFNTFETNQNQALNENKDTLATNVNPYGTYNYNIPATAAPTANKTDLSSYTPFTEFQNVTNQTPVAMGGKVSAPNAFTSTTPLDAFLGKNKLNTNQTDYLKKYLLQGITA